MASTGGYTLPPTAAYFPVTTYTAVQQHDNTQQVMMSQDSLNVQPNTPDLLMHRRQVKHIHEFFQMKGDTLLSPVYSYACRKQ